MARDYFDESKKKKKTVARKPQSSSANAKKNIQTAQQRGQRQTANTNVKAQQSYQNNRTTSVSGRSAASTAHRQEQQRSTQPTARRTTNAPTATNMRRNTPATAAEMRRQNAQNQKSTAGVTREQQEKTKQRFTTAKEMMNQRAEEGRKQKMGENSVATKEQKKTVERAIRNTPSVVKKAAMDAGSGYMQTLTEITDMTASSEAGARAKAMKLGYEYNDTEGLAKVKEERRRTVKAAREDNKKLHEAQKKRQEEFDKKTKGAKGLEKAYYGALESGTGMLADIGIGAITGTGQAGSLASMYMRTFGSSTNQARDEGATDKEARRYGFWQSNKEVGTELMFPGAGLAKKAYGKAGLPLAERAANRLIKGLSGRAADVTHTGLRLAGGMAEENLEEAGGWLLDPVIKEFTYGKNVRKREAQDVMNRISEDMRSKIVDENDAASASAYLSSDAFLEDTKNDYMEEGLSEKEAEAVANKMRDFLTASLTGDTETMERLEDEISKDVAKSHNILEDYSGKELLETIASTSLLTGVTGLPGSVTSSMKGAALRDELGEKGIRALAKTAIDFEDETDSYKGQAARDRLDSGKELTSTQVYELAEATQKQIEKDSRRQEASVDNASKRIKAENLIAPYGVNANGEMVIDDVINEKFETNAKAAETTIKNFDANREEGQKSLTDTAVRNGSRAIARWKAGVFTVEDANELNYSNTAVRSAFEEETGVNLGQYVVKDKNGKVDIPKTNAATKDALFAMASDNLVESAREATVNWMDNVKGEVVSQVTARMGAQGSLALQSALDDVDERNRSEYMMVANASDMLYQSALNIGTEWDNVKAEATKMFPNISENKLQAMYEAGLIDRDMATDKYRGKSVRLGEAISSLEDSDKANVTGQVFVDTETPLKGTVVRAFTEVATNLGVDIHLVDNLPTDSGQQANGMYDKGTIYINVNSSFEQNMGYIFMHEVTHHLKEYAPEEYAALERLVREKWFEYDDAQMQSEIAKKIDLYNRATNGKQTLTEAEALEEIIADAAHEFLNDPNFANQVAEDNPNLAKAVLESIRNALRMLRRILSTGSIDDETHMNSLFSQLDIFDEAERLWLNAYRTAVANKAALAIDNWQDDVNESYSLGYHAGDLGKSRVDDYSGQGYSRGTGHFGFGTYFVGNQEQVRFGDYKSRPLESVEFDNYNLYRPKNFEKGLALHDALKVLDGYAHDYSDFAKYSDMSDVDAWHDAFDEKMYITSHVNRDLDEVTWDLYEGNKPNAERKARIDNLVAKMPESYREGIEEQTAEYIEKNRDAEYKPNEATEEEYWRYEAIADAIKEYSKDFESEADKFDNLESKLQRAMDYRFSEKTIRNALKKTEEIVQGYGPRYKAERGLDSPATVFMKELGFEGVDVRHIPEMDNTGYGSVIYDLKGEDLERKNEIGTARYSISEQQDADYMKAVESGDMETAQRMVDEAAEKAMPNSILREGGELDIFTGGAEEGKLIKMYHGSGAKDFYEFKLNDGALGKGAYFTSSPEEATEYAVFASDEINENDDWQYEWNDTTYDSIGEIGEELEKQGYVRAFYLDIEDSHDLNISPGLLYAVARNRSQIKSADPVTYDDDGNVIPLSQRFNAESDDVRFSLNPVDAKGKPLSDDQRYFFRNLSDELKDENGNMKRYYHGTARGDRVGYIFDPARATSGPMAFFTDDPIIAENYSKSKADTSIAYEESDMSNYHNQFTVEVDGEDVNLEDYWNMLTPEEQQDLAERAGHVTYDWDEYDIIYDENVTDGTGGYMGDPFLVREAKGNVFRMLIDEWLDSGNLYGEEEKFLEVMNLLGVEGVKYHDPNYRDETVFEQYLNITNPFVTRDVNSEFADNLEKWLDDTDLDKYKKESAAADMWDKNSVDPYDWLERIRNDIEHETTHAWTSIPDVITAYLQEQGYDGIVDEGGKYHDAGHQVVIPFSSEQVKDINNEHPTDNPDKRYSLQDDRGIITPQRAEEVLLENHKEYESDKTNLKIAVQALTELSDTQLSWVDILKGEGNEAASERITAETASGRQLTWDDLEWADVEETEGLQGSSDGRRLTANTSGIRTVATRIPEEIAQKGYIDFRGHKVPKPVDLAKICQVLRNPHYETQRIFYLKGDTIVGHRAVSSHLPSETENTFYNRDAEYYSEETAYHLDAMKRLGADGYYLVHNHPSGYTEPSKGDKRVTDGYKNTLPGFKGHIVLDHGKYGFISPAGRKQKDKTIPGDWGADPNILPNLDNPWLGVKFEGLPWEIARISNEVMTSDEMSVVVFYNSKFHINEIQEISNKVILNDKNFANYIKNEHTRAGAGRAFVYTKNKDVADLTEGLIKTRHIEIVMYDDPNATEAPTYTYVSGDKVDLGFNKKIKQNTKDYAAGGAKYSENALHTQDELERIQAKSRTNKQDRIFLRDNGAKLSHKDFNNFYSAHKLNFGKSITDVDALVEKIKEEGFRSRTSLSNVVPASINDTIVDGKPNFTQGLYGAEKGDTVLLIPENYTDLENDTVISGFKPLPYEVVTVERDFQPYYELYEKAYDKEQEAEKRYSITEDANGKTLTENQRDYFKNSQARDEQGRLVRVFHTTRMGGFTVFDPSFSDDRKSLFFTDLRRMSESYAREDGRPTGDIDPYNPKGTNVRKIENVNALPSFDSSEMEEDIRNRISNISVVDANGVPVLEGDDFVETAIKIAEMMESEGYDLEEDFNIKKDRLIKDTGWQMGEAWEVYANAFELNLQYTMDYEDTVGTYNCYLNLENPLIIDCSNAYWNSILEDGFKKISTRPVPDSENEFFVTLQSAHTVKDHVMTLNQIAEVYDDEIARQISEYDWANTSVLNNVDFYTYAGQEYNPEEEGLYPQEGDTRFWCDYAWHEGYDGVIFENVRDYGDSGYGNEPGNVYVAFSSNQVKDVNNLNPTENPDIRYSITDEDEAKSKMAYDEAMDDSIDALVQYEMMMDNESFANNFLAKPMSEEQVANFYAGLKATDSWVHTDPIDEEDAVRMAQSKNDFFANLNAKWNDRWTTGGEVLDVESVKTDVRNLVMGVMQNSDTDSQYKNDLVKKTLFDIRTAFQLMKQDRPEVASELLYYSAQRMIDNVQFYVDGTFDQYKDLKQYLKTTKISLGEDYWEDVEYDKFRKRNFGRMRLVKGSTNVDQVYQELEEMFPEFFDSEETMDVPSQLLQMEHVLDTVQPYKEAYSSEAAAELAFDIADGLYDIMMNGDEVRSLADTYKARYDEKTRAMKQRHAEAMLRVRKARDEGIQAERQKFREYKERQKERQKEKKLHRKEFDSIQKSYNTLKDRLLSNTADSNIPEQYKKELAGLLAAFDLQTVKSKQLEKTKMRRSQKAIKMSAIRTALRQIEVRTQQFFHVNDAITDIIDELLGVNAEYPAAASIEGKTIDELSVEELIRIDKLLKALVHEFNTYKNVRIQDRNEKAQDIADAQVTSALEHAKKFGPGTDWHGIRGGIDKVLNMDEVTPAYMFRMIDRENKGLGMMWKELERSHDKYIRNTEQLRKWMSEITGKYHNKGRFGNKYGADEIAEWRRSRSVQDFNLTNGSISLTPAQMMSLAMLANRPQAYQHMIGAGVVVAPVNFQAKMETDLKRKTNRALPLVLTDADIKLIVSQLTPEQRKVAEDLQQLMANQMAEWGNEASMDVLGIRLFEEKEYFPIKSDKAALEKDLTADQFEQAIRNFGFTKAVMPGARNAIMIDDIFDVVTEHCNNMNLYNSYSKALNDFMKVYNKHTFQEDGSDYSVAQALGHAYSQKTTNFILNFVKDINGNVSRGRDTGIESLLQGQLANAKKASVFANIRVLLQQPTAITRAFAVINPKYLKGVKIEKGAMEEMFEHCPIAKWKSWGYYDINMGKNIEDIIMNEGNFLEDLATQAYGAADNVTWTAIWQMVKAEMKDTHPDAVEGSDEFWYQCNERMREIVDLTQVVDSPMHRSHAMRDKNFFVKMATSFMAEPTLTFNMVRDGYIRAKEAWDLGNKKEAASIMGKTMLVYVLQAATVAAAAAIADAIRGKKPDGGGDDEDKDFFSNWWANTLANFKDEIALWNKVYYVKDIASIFEGYEAWNLGTQGISNFVKGYNQLTKKLSEGSKTSWWNIYQNLLGGIGYMTGIPIKTLMKDGKAIFEMLGGKLPKNLVGEEKSEAVVDKDSAFGRLIAPKDKSDSKSASAVRVSEGEHWYDYGNNPLSVKDGSALDKFLNRFGVNLTGAEKAAAIQAQKDKALEEKANEIADSVADLDEEEKAKKTWSKVTTFIKDEEGRSINDLIKEGEYSIIDQYRDLFIAAGNDPDYFDERVMSASKKALKKTISYEMSDDEMYAQQEMIAYLRMGGVTDAEISEIAYKSDIAKDVKVAMRLGDEELVMEAVMPLVQAGITQEDFDKLWTNRNRIDLKKYDGRFKDQLKSTGSYTWPCQGTITSEFGRRSAPTAGASSYHQAIDIGAAAGTPVGAADGGVVVFAGWNGAAGKTVKVQHDDGTITQYSHLQWWNVKEGDSVGQGQEIGLVGSTGVSTGPHLHFGVMRNGKYVNPMDYLS